MCTTWTKPSQAKLSTFRNLALTALTFPALCGALFPAALRAQPTPPQVAWVEPAGGDLEVTLLAATPTPSTGLLDLVVTNPSCGEVARQPVMIPTAEVTTVLPNVLGNVLGCGPQYTVFLENLNGTVGLPLPFQVQLTCDGALLCDYRLAPGVEVENALVVSQDLAQAISQATGQGSLVDAVTSSHPHLRDEVLTYAFHLDRLLASQGSTLNSTCSCQWMGSIDNSQVKCTGAFHPYSVQASPADPLDSRSGSTTLTVSPVCHSLSSGLSTSLLLPGGQIVTVPSFKSCTPIISPPELTGFQLTFEGRAQAWGPLDYVAEASIAVGFRFDGVTHTLGSAEVSKSTTEDGSFHTPLSLDSDLVFANQATVFTYALAEAHPATAEAPSTLLFPGHPPLGAEAGAEAGGTLTLEAIGGLDLFLIRLWEPTSFWNPIDDSLDEGEDVEICSHP